MYCFRKSLWANLREDLHKKRRGGPSPCTTQKGALTVYKEGTKDADDDILKRQSEKERESIY